MIEEIKEKLLENKTLVAVLGTILVMLIGFFAWSNVTKTTVDAQSDLPALSTTFSASSSASDLKTERSSSQTETQKVFVDIKGAVKNEGVYELSSGSRVTDVVKLAGGFTEDADKKSVNLAEKVTDEAVIYVARVGENVAPTTTNSQANGSAQQEESSDKINLNTATLAELQTISGIGAKRAQDIIDYRDANGGFSSVDDLANVSGIGEKTLEKLKSEVTVD
ncbi:helix-hairpin-helix domain-containing protein [Streptococcus gallolyticus subsp. gallolyticus]|uniref:Competence protein ComEA n=1 Tax=Streptococcus gallolyticus TaxID=315405 RepID=A0A1I7F217_9STRE|nr:helix-hairpin-helix domain-containing protein [Streptococcus gallolyticus]MCF1633755.1 helix-hairpin-helix domain-containing protein [Streptococcus gallolyticus]MCY7151345.1 helix-hairpin-helix domain-containing protein [Streptococcus gallolyticus subsp. gallolyticus]MCY7158738.1 helix-hairpin-helix domain-containing protein [Streptococcus gallolyticus subsp. gallolyticus]CBZ47777.1 competence protein ComEA [Streptococcus gallolyticus subsp. gallolyticus ATCC BAA-2069]SFC00353.1 competence 